jgi:hypothetical protein
MDLARRRYLNIFAIFSGLLFAASLGVHIASYVYSAGMSMSSTWYIHVLLFIPFGYMVVRSSLHQNHSLIKDENTSFDKFEKTTSRIIRKYKQIPAIIRPIILFIGIALVLYLPFNFFIGMAHLGHGGPDYSDGRYFLSSQGKYVRDLTKEEYIQYQAYEVRLFSGHWMLFTGIPLIYFSFVDRKVQS